VEKEEKNSFTVVIYILKCCVVHFKKLCHISVLTNITGKNNNIQGFVNNPGFVLFSSLTHYLPSLPKINIISLMILTLRRIHYLGQFQSLSTGNCLYLIIIFINC